MGRGAYNKVGLKNVLADKILAHVKARKSPIDKFTCYLPVTQVFFKKL